MNIIKALNNKSGVENLGVQIQPDDETIEPMANVVFVGIFKRGRVDQPFQVTEANYRAVLGYDPRNKVFQAIEDAFKTGISSVWVQRVANISDKENNAPWGDWVLNSGVVITGGMARYTGYKTNGYKYFDSFADIDLTDAIIRSFHDDDMQQWQGFLDAVNDLIGSVDWVLDPANNRVIYHEKVEQPPLPLIYLYDGEQFYNPEAALEWRFTQPAWGDYYDIYRNGYCAAYTSNQKVGNCYYQILHRSNGWVEVSLQWTTTINPAYDPEAQPEQKTLPLDVVAQQVISNASSSNQAISLLAEVYLEAVANSIFNQDESKQFLKLTDLIAQFEENKIART